MKNLVVLGVAALAGAVAAVTVDSDVQATVIRSIPGMEGVPVGTADQGCWIESVPGRFLSSTCKTTDRFMDIPLDISADDTNSTTKSIKWFPRIGSGQTLCAHPIAYFATGAISSAPAEQCGSGNKTQSLTSPPNGTVVLSVRGNFGTGASTMSGIWSVNYAQ